MSDCDLVHEAKAFAHLMIESIGVIFVAGGLIDRKFENRRNIEMSDEEVRIRAPQYHDQQVISRVEFGRKDG